MQWADTNILEDFPISKGCFEAERSLSCSPNLFLTLFHDLKTEGGFYSPELGLYLSSEPRGNTVQHSSKDKEEPSLFRCRIPQLLCESYWFFPKLCLWLDRLDTEVEPISALCHSCAVQGYVDRICGELGVSSCERPHE